MSKKLIPKVYGLLLNTQALFSKKAASKNAFQVYCKVRKGKVLDEQRSFLEGAKHELLQIPEHTIQTYHWAGTRKKVLLVHGWESNTYRWKALIAKLQTEDFDIYAFDAPGHGNSSGTILHHPLYETALQNTIEKYKPECLIGHSMGGMTIMYNQYLNPEARIEKIVCIASPSEYHELMRFYKQLLSLSKRLMTGIEDYFKTQFGYVFNEFSTAQFAKTNTKTGLLIHDKHDSTTPYWSSEQVYANWKNSQLITTQGLGHSIQDDNINKQIIDFLES